MLRKLASNIVQRFQGNMLRKLAAGGFFDTVGYVLDPFYYEHVARKNAQPLNEQDIRNFRQQQRLREFDDSYRQFGERLNARSHSTQQQSMPDFLDALDNARIFNKSWQPAVAGIGDNVHQNYAGLDRTWNKASKSGVKQYSDWREQEKSKDVEYGAKTDQLVDRWNDQMKRWGKTP